MNTALEKRRMLGKLRGDPVGHDFVGRELMVGDLIVYGASSSGGTSVFKAGLILGVDHVRGRHSELKIISYVPHSVAGYRWRDLPGWTRAHGRPRLKHSHCRAMLWPDPPEDLAEMVEHDRLTLMELFR